MSGVEPRGTYRGRGEIGGVYLPSQVVILNFVRDGSYMKGDGRAPPPHFTSLG